MKHAKKIYLTTVLALSLAVAGCSNQNDKKAEAPSDHKQGAVQAVTEQTASAPGQADPHMMDEVNLTGTVVETFDSAGYTYIELDTGSEKIWTAIGQAKVAVGDSISLMSGPVMKDFHSKTLDRTFPEIIFSAGLAGGGAHPGGNMMGGAAGGAASFADAMVQEGGNAMVPPPGMAIDQASGGSIKAVSSVQDIKVEKIEGGHTVEEIYTSVADLAGQKIKVRGKIVKVSPNIMGRTWIHIQDGTGNAMNNSHDLVLTSAEIPENDSIAVFEGVVAKDKDFGAGYFYNVIVEEAVTVK